MARTGDPQGTATEPPQESALVPTQPHPTFGHRGPGASEGTKAAAATAVPSEGSLEQMANMVLADANSGNGPEYHYIGDDISELSVNTPPRGAAAKVSDSPDTKRQAAEAAGQPKPVPSASSIDRKAQAAADQMQTGHETCAAQPGSSGSTAGQHTTAPARLGPVGETTGAEATSSGAEAPLPLGN